MSNQTYMAVPQTGSESLKKSAAISTVFAVVINSALFTAKVTYFAF